MRTAPSPVTETDSRDDELLLDLLCEVFEQIDPVPDHVVAAGRAVFQRRAVGPA